MEARWEIWRDYGDCKALEGIDVTTKLPTGITFHRQSVFNTFRSWPLPIINAKIFSPFAGLAAFSAANFASSDEKSLSLPVVR